MAATTGDQAVASDEGVYYAGEYTNDQYYSIDPESQSSIIAKSQRPFNSKSSGRRDHGSSKGSVKRDKAQRSHTHGHKHSNKSRKDHSQIFENEIEPQYAVTDVYDIEQTDTTSQLAMNLESSLEMSQKYASYNDEYSGSTRYEETAEADPGEQYDYQDEYSSRAQIYTSQQPRLSIPESYTIRTAAFFKIGMVISVVIQTPQEKYLPMNCIFIQRYIILNFDPSDQTIHCNPITTYDEKGWRERGIQPARHVELYASETPPRIPEHCPFRPLRVRKVTRQRDLPRESLVKLWQVVKLPFNSLTKEIGELSDGSLRRFLDYSSQIWEDCNEYRGFAYLEPPDIELECEILGEPNGENSVSSTLGYVGVIAAALVIGSLGAGAGSKGMSHSRRVGRIDRNKRNY